jgi:hypothetical protein|tara:strand:+ start:95 stop:277 length:183 start_codon:yes stop_codon:yes gene_type:complete
MRLSHEDWLRVPLLLESLRGMFKELPDEQLEYLKRLAIGEQKKASDSPVSEGTHTRHSKP